MEQNSVLIADIVRTPWGKPGGSMERFLSSDFSAPLLTALLARTGLPAQAVDQVVFGQARPSTYPNNIGHFAWLKAGLPVEVPGYTVQCNTASGLQALRNAYYLIASGNEEICIAGGADSYSTAPFAMRNVRNHFYPKDRVVIDTIEEGEMCTQPIPMTRLEQYSALYGSGSKRGQAFVQEDREKALQFAAGCAGHTIHLSYTDRKKGEIIVSKDEWLSLNPTDEPLAPYADGGAAALLISRARAEQYKLPVLGELLGFSTAGCTPTAQGAGAVAVKNLLGAKQISICNIDHFEIIENSAEDVFAVMDELGVSSVNPCGGALSFGKNDGAEGIFMILRLLSALDTGQLGVACIYSAGGLGMAALVRKH